MRVLFCAFVSLLGSFLPAPRVQADVRTVVINELMANNEGAVADEQGDHDDWIELYNYGQDAVDMAGCFLSDDSGNPTKWRVPASDPAATTIAAHGYLLLWADDEVGEGPLHAGFKLSADGESVTLYSPQGELLDETTFGALAPDASYARLTDGDGLWQVCTAPTPGRSNDAGSGGIVISEIMYHPYHPPLAPEDTRLEWIELLNRGGQPVQLAGWRLADGVDFTFPEIILNASQYLVVVADVDAFRARYPGVQNVVGGWTGGLSNSGENLTLVDSIGAAVASLSYADEGEWAVRELGPLDYEQRGWQWGGGHDGGGGSLELVNPALSGRFGQNWVARLVEGGTPGRPNSAGSDDLAPMIVQVHHAPVIPGPTDAVTVKVRILDERTTGLAVTLHYRLDASAYVDQYRYPQHDAAAYTSAQMFDDGEHGDGRAADGIFAAEIPPQADGRIIEFYVEARDAAGNSRMWPAPSMVDGVPEQVTNALYQVVGSFDPAARWVPGSQPIYFLIMTEAERARLEDIGNGRGGLGAEDDSDSNARMNGTFISVDGTGTELRYQVGIRNRGKGSRDTAGGRYRNNYRVDFPTDNPWNDVTAINIKARHGYVAVLGSAIWRMANLPAERISPIQVLVNRRDLALADSTMFGSYALVEVIDDEFAARHFPGDREGNAYRCGNDVADLGYEGPDPNAYRAGYEKQTNSAANDYNDLIELTFILNHTPPERLVEEARKVIHLEQWLRFLAVDALCGNREGGLTTPRGDDYAMYRGVHDSRFWLIPHDLDTLLGQGGTAADIHRDIHVYAGLDGLHELLTHPDVLPLYHAQLLELIETVFSPEQFDPLVDHLLGDWVPEETRTAIKQFVVQRNAAVLAQIPQQLTVSSPLPEVSGYPYTTARTYTLSGRAHAAQTRSVLVNGVPASWSAQEGTWQSGGLFRSAQTLVRSGSEWRYLDDGSDQGTAWQAPGFDGAAWRTGRAELGYGDGDEATVIDGGPASNRFTTSYFRKTFSVADAAEYGGLRLRLLCGDGAVVYLNGVEVCRSAMPEGPVNYATLAVVNIAGVEERAFVEYEAPVNLLLEGDNTLAVEVHQASTSSADLSFDVALEAARKGQDPGGLFPVTWRTSATLTVGGPEIYGYRYRVNDNPWSDEVRRPGAGLAGDPEPMPPVVLTDLQNEQAYTVYVIGKDSAGVWQSEDAATASRTWVVDASFERLVINEVLAVNESTVGPDGTFPDMVELYYDGPATISLAGMTLSDDPQEPAKYVLPAGTTMHPGDYLVLYADAAAGTSGHHLGFSLNAAGDGVYLFDPTGALIDSVEFGRQLPDLSVGRVEPEGRWHLTIPTFGGPNLSQPLGDPRTIRINEWLASEAVLFESDFIELYNPRSLPVDLGGFYLTDTPETEPDLHRLAPLTFVADGGYAVFDADGRSEPGHLGFKLSPVGDMVALFDAGGNEIDRVIFLWQTTDVSQGRTPDGADKFAFLLLPTPGLPNFSLPETTVTTFDLIPEEAAKRAMVPTSTDQVAADWNSNPDFDDASWLSAAGAPGGVGFERSLGYEQLISLDVEEQMYGRNTTCYIRVPFYLEGDPAASFSELYLGLRYDDGFVAYLNGVEVARANAPDDLQWDSAATGSHEAGYSSFDEVLDLTDRLDLLHAGMNLLAVQAMNSSRTSSDFILSAILQGTSVEGGGGDYPYLNESLLLEGLRVTELMYHAPQGEQLDYIELRNVTAVPLDLSGVRFTAGITFVFPPMILNPGECTVVAGDPAAFRERYGADVNMAGQYTGHLSNNGERLTLHLAPPFEAAIMRFGYADAWFPTTDGGGEALAIRNAAARPVTWNDPESWQASPPDPGR